MDGRQGRILDISRLLARLSHSAPTGIDRVEFAYAQHYASTYKNGIVRFLVTTPYYCGRISPLLARHVARVSRQRWSFDDEAAGSERFAHLLNMLASPIRPSLAAEPVRIVEARSGVEERGVSALLFSAYDAALMSALWQRKRHREIQRRSWYLHVSHMNLHAPDRLRWVKHPDGRALFMVHDLLPISHPEFYRPEEAARHRSRLETVASLADLIVFNSAATKAAWDDYAADVTLVAPPGVVVPLGVDPLFLDRTPLPRVADEPPYFIVVGTIEARKNLTFLLHVWREWIRRHGAPKARLVIVGRRKDRHESAIDLIERSPALAQTVVEVSELADIRVVRLLKGAHALLAPSAAEGFGLPIAEALAAGTPVIAADTPAHREVAGVAADYLDAVDGRSWLQALDDYANETPRRREALQRVANSKSRSWGDHIADVEDLMKQHDRGSC